MLVGGFLVWVFFCFFFLADGPGRGVGGSEEGGGSYSVLSAVVGVRGGVAV